MNVSETKALERVARVLAGQRLSVNGEGQGQSVGREVDATWTQYLDDALAVMRTLREPDADMAAAGDAATWCAMIQAALGERGESLTRDRRPIGGNGAVYQKPLG
jgi:hypothetical protein